MKGITKADNIATSLQLAMLLEVSAYPKPGNVDRSRDFEDMKYEHFLASSSALFPIWRMAAQRGLDNKNSSGYLIGDLVFTGCREMLKWQKGGNTSLGVILLLAPLAFAAGLASRRYALSPTNLRSSLSSTLSRTTPKDMVSIFKAIKEVNPGGLGESEKLDVTNKDSQKTILKENMSPIDVFKIAASWDAIAREWVTDFSITFTVGFPTFMEEIKETEDINTAAIQTFLTILSKERDTLIIRKVDVKTAEKIRYKAQQILDQEGVKTVKGRRLLTRLDNLLRSKGNRMNPGTTADLVCSSISVAILHGTKP